MGFFWFLHLLISIFLATYLSPLIYQCAHTPTHLSAVAKYNACRVHVKPHAHHKSARARSQNARVKYTQAVAHGAMVRARGVRMPCPHGRPAAPCHVYISLYTCGLVPIPGTTRSPRSISSSACSAHTW